jgi:hypothetical protein
MPELEIRERPPSTLRNIDGGPPGRCWRRSRSAHHQHKNRRWWAPWWVLTEIQERPPSTLKIVDGGPHGICRSWRSESAHHQHKKTSMTGSLAPVGVSGPRLGSKRCVVNPHRHDRQKNNSAHRSHFPCTWSCYG